MAQLLTNSISSPGTAQVFFFEGIGHTAGLLKTAELFPQRHGQHSYKGKIITESHFGKGSKRFSQLMAKATVDRLIGIKFFYFQFRFKGLDITKQRKPSFCGKIEGCT